MDHCATCVSLMAIFLCFISQAVNIVAGGESLKRNGEALIGGLVSVHQKRSIADDECEIPDFQGILTVEAILFAIEEINSKRQIDLKVKLGYDIRDTCPEPFEAAKALVMNAPKEEFLAAVVGNLPQEQLAYHHVLLLLLSSWTPHMSCIPSTYRVKNKPDLISRNEFIFHAVSRDTTNLMAIAYLAASYNWTYVAVVYDDSGEGRHRARLFQQEASKKFVCVARNYVLPANSSATQIQKFITALKAARNFSVIVMLTSKSLFKGIFDEASKQKMNDLTWIVSDDSWDNKVTFFKNNTAAHGTFRVGTSAPIVKFKEFLYQLCNNPQRNKWIMEMVSSKSSVSSPKDKQPTVPASVTSIQPSIAINVSSGNVSTPQCSDPPSNVNQTKLRQIVETLVSMADSATCTIDSVFAVAHALAQKEKCAENCPQNHEFYTYIQKVNFKSLSGHNISFNDQRNLDETEYKIWNLPKNSFSLSAKGQSELKLSEVGSWKQSGNGAPEMTLRSKKIHWNAKNDQIPKSICHEPCSPGSYKALKKNATEAECCWHCLKCRKNTVSTVKDSLTCITCSDGWAPRPGQDSCIKQVEDYAYWSDGGSLVICSEILLLVSAIFQAIRICE